MQKRLILIAAKILYGNSTLENRRIGVRCGKMQCGCFKIRTAVLIAEIAMADHSVGLLLQKATTLSDASTFYVVYGIKFGVSTTIINQARDNRGAI